MIGITNSSRGRKKWVSAVVACLTVPLLALGLTSGSAAGAAPGASSPSTPAAVHASAKPTIVLEHGAFADASGWDGVTARLQQRGYTVYAPANPLRGLVSDSEYLRSFLSTISGPIVLVGHSYGGATVSNAATGNTKIKALVFINAYALAKGESVADANALGGGTTDLLAHLIARPLPGAAAGQDKDGYIDPAFYRQIFAQDLPVKKTAVMAASQRPAALSALGTPSGEPAWRTIPSWYLVSTDDHTIPPAAERVMAKRAHAHTIEIHSSHVAMISHPSVVTKLILDAANCH